MVFPSINSIQTIVSNIYHINMSNEYVVDAITVLFNLLYFIYVHFAERELIYIKIYIHVFFVEDQIEQTLIKQCAIM